MLRAESVCLVALVIIPEKKGCSALFTSKAQMESFSLSMPWMTMEFSFSPPAFWLFALCLLSFYQGGVPPAFLPPPTPSARTFGLVASMTVLALELKLSTKWLAGAEGVAVHGWMPRYTVYMRFCQCDLFWPTLFSFCCSQLRRHFKPNTVMMRKGNIIHHKLRGLQTFGNNQV